MRADVAPVQIQADTTFNCAMPISTSARSAAVTSEPLGEGVVSPRPAGEGTKPSAVPWTNVHYTA